MRELDKFIEEVERLKSITMAFSENGRHANADGVICPEKYFYSPLKITWILQESYGDGSADQPSQRNACSILSDFGSEGYKTFRPIVSLPYILKTGIEYYPGLEDTEDAYNMFRETTSYINIKRVPDLGSETTNKFNDWALKEENAKLLLEQLKCYAPDIIISEFFTLLY